MEWVETTGKTVAEAKERALDGLGVDDADAEYEILQEPRTGLFGRVRVEARIRARVRPTKPPAKEDRRDRRRRRRSPGQLNGDAPPAVSPAVEDDGEQGMVRVGQTMPDHGGSEKGLREKDRGDQGLREKGAASPGGHHASSSGTKRPGRGRGRRPTGESAGEQHRDANAVERVSTTTRPDARAGQRNKGSGHEQSTRVDVESASASRDEGEGAGMEVTLEDQSRVAHAFLTGLVERMGLAATIAVETRDEETLELALAGDDLGVLIGPRGTTLYALQDLTRTVVQRQTRAENGRLMVDVGGYRQKRQEALIRFVQHVAIEVKAEGGRKALEPMSAADRKVVHDTVNQIDGVTTVSEGEDSSRHVVLVAQD